MFYLSEDTISKIFWEKLYSSPLVPKARDDIGKILEHTRKIREYFPAESAGTISPLSSEQLWLIAKYFAPQHIFEIGTFIGRSTLSLLAGTGSTIERFDTCDMTFDKFEIPDEVEQDFPDAKKINYWPKTSSITALSNIISSGARPDFLFIDGRLSDEDIGLFRELDPNNTIFVFDDFEGIEKGVQNCILLQKSLPELLLIRPSQTDFAGSGQIAILFPSARIRLTRQQSLPVSLQL
jgi:hypothetical protein